MTPRVFRAASIALTGLTGTPVMVEAALSQQLPGMAIIGLPDTALAEAKLRVKSATLQAGLPLSQRFILVNLSPAALPKHGSAFDLAIALAALAASGKVSAAQLAETVHVGELALGGELRRPAGLLTAIIAARDLGCARVMVPEACATEAALVHGIEIIAVKNLAGAVAWHQGEAGEWQCVSSLSGRNGTEPHCESSPTAGSVVHTAVIHTSASPLDEYDEFAEAETHDDMSDVIGQNDAVEALVIAAAGKHHISMLGPPGAGKTLLARRLPTILPDLNEDEALTVSSIASLGGVTLTQLVKRPPFESPHHTASPVAIVGGGVGTEVRPGAITRACHGVLFLDEAPEFSRKLLDTLRQPLEQGIVEIHRSRFRATLPADVQLVLAANPCPCGNAGSAEIAVKCQCSPTVRVKYLQRISGPLTDRIDVRLTVRRVSSVLASDPSYAAPTSATLRSRVLRARQCAAERLRDTPWKVNSEASGNWLRSPRMKPPRTHTAVLDRALATGSLTLRGYDRALRLAWSVADLNGRTAPGREEIATALELRQNEML